MSLFETLMFLITRGKTDGLAAKAEKLYTGGKLTEEEYKTLTEMLAEKETEVAT